MKVSIHTEFIKLDSFLKLAGEYPDGASAKHDILDGKVSVNDEVCLMRGKKLYPGDRVEARGELYEVVSD